MSDKDFVATLYAVGTYYDPDIIVIPLLLTSRQRDSPPIQGQLYSVGSRYITLAIIARFVSINMQAPTVIVLLIFLLALLLSGASTEIARNVCPLACSLLWSVGEVGCLKGYPCKSKPPSARLMTSHDPLHTVTKLMHDMLKPPSEKVSHVPHFVCSRSLVRLVRKWIHTTWLGNARDWGIAAMWIAL
jgi:hypothetical protein